MTQQEAWVWADALQATGKYKRVTVDEGLVGTTLIYAVCLQYRDESLHVWLYTTAGCLAELANDPLEVPA